MRNIKIGFLVALCLIAIALCGLLAYGMTGRLENHMFTRSGHHYTDMQLVLEEEIPLDGIESISVLYGMNSNDILIYESENDALTIKEYSCSELGANELSTITRNDDSLAIKGARRNYDRVGFHLFYFNVGYDRHYTEVFLPSSYHGELILETASGDIVSDMDIDLNENLSIASTSGDIQFSSVNSANASVTSSSGNVTLDNIHTDGNGPAGNITVKTTSGDIRLKELTGETKIESTSGYLTAETISGDARLRTTSGDVHIREITGDTNAESSSGNLTIEAISGKAQLRTTSGDVNIQQIDGNLQTVTTSGNTRVLGGSGERSVSASSGDITVEGTEGDIQANTQSGNVRFIADAGKGTIETTSGDIWLEVKELTGSFQLGSSSGNANMKLAADNGFEFTADTISGSIITFFDQDLQISSDRDHASGIYGTNTQANQITIKTTSGDIKITKF